MSDKVPAADATAGKPTGRPGWEWRRTRGMNAIGVVIIFAAGAAVERMSTVGDGHLLAYLGATVFGMLVGATELIARYRDRPTAPMETVPGIIYIAVNGSVSLAVFWFLRTGQIALTASTVLGPTLNQVLVAGFGSMALFRTSIFTLRVRDMDVAVGPAAVLQVILTAADRECDRLRAGPRAKEVKNIMRGVSFARAKSGLVLHCLALMQNVSPSEQSQLTQAISVLETARMSDEVRAYNLGLLLMTFVGEDVLKEAVNALGATIQGPALDDPPIFSQAGSFAFAEMQALISICAALDPLDREKEVAKHRASWTTLEPSLEHEPDKNVIVLARLRRYFGPDTVSQGMFLLTEGKTPVRRVTEPLKKSDFLPPQPDAQTGPGSPGRP